MKHLRPLGFALALVVLLATGGIAAATDTFTCYTARTDPGAIRFAPRPGVGLVDRLRSSTVEVKKPRFLCSPVDLNGGDPDAPSHPDHLEDYQIKTPRFAIVRGVHVVDELGALDLDLRKPTTLQVPAAKSVSGSPTPPSAPAVDHFQCYQVRTTKGAAKFARRTVTLTDQLGPYAVDLVKPRRLCLPVDKNGEDPGAENHADHLVCYQAKTRSRLAAASPVYTANQFGNEALRARKLAEVCVPAAEAPVGPTATPTPTPTPTPTVTPTPPPLCGNGALDAGEECDGLLAPTCPGQCQPSCACPGVCDPLDPSVCLHPFPNDYFTVADASTVTGRRVNLALTAMPRNAANVPVDPTDLNRADGFSPGSPIIVRVPGFDAAMTGSVPITDVARSFDASQPIVVINAATLQRHLIWSEIDSNPAAEADRVLYVRPAVNFAEGTRYVVALRNLKNAAGALIAPNADFLAYRDVTPTGDPAKEARRPHMEDVFATLASAGIARNDLYLAWDFTVASRESLTKRALAMRDDAFGANGLGDPDLTDLAVEGAAPAFTIVSATDLPPCGGDGCAGGTPPENPPGGQEFCDALQTVSELAPFLVGVNCNLLPGSTPSESDQTARRVEGSITVPCYLFPSCQPGGTFVLDANGLPTRNPADYSANFVCNIPRAAFSNGDATTGTAVPARPSLYGHGLLGTASEVGAGNVQAMGNEHNVILCATDWAGFSTSDVGSVVATLQDASQFPRLVDRMQQGFLNFLYLGRALLHADGLAADAAFKDGAGNSLLDRTRLYYDGNSQGGIMGGALTALAPDFTRAVLGVPGMNYSTLLQRSSDFAPYAEGKLLGAISEDLEIVDTPFGLYDNYPNELERPLIFTLMQMLWDRGEANGYAHHMTTDPLPNTPPHTVLLHEAFGDHQVANITTEVEARTIGASIFQPALAAGRHADVDPYSGIPAIATFPFAGSALVVWDNGTPTPPIENVPPFSPAYGNDPHGRPRAQVSARLQKSEFLKPAGGVVDVCSGAPCLAP